VFEGKRADDDVYGIVGQRQRVKLGDVELGLRDAPSRVSEHVR
jgi:hypothetical protein